jgi:hypothetical protein
MHSKDMVLKKLNGDRQREQCKQGWSTTLFLHWKWLSLQTTLKTVLSEGSERS